MDHYTFSTILGETEDTIADIAEAIMYGQIKRIVLAAWDRMG